MKYLKLICAVLIFQLFQPLFAAQPLVVEASVKDNPTIFFKGVEGSAAINNAVRSFLAACGWFDLSASPKADYQLSGRVSGGVFTYELSLGGAPL